MLLLQGRKSREIISSNSHFRIDELTANIKSLWISALRTIEKGKAYFCISSYFRFIEERGYILKKYPGKEQVGVRPRGKKRDFIYFYFFFEVRAKYALLKSRFSLLGSEARTSVRIFLLVFK
jgi:hypothetical protein